MVRRSSQRVRKSSVKDLGGVGWHQDKLKMVGGGGGGGEGGVGVGAKN